LYNVYGVFLRQLNPKVQFKLNLKTLLDIFLKGFLFFKSKI